ncbi:MAG TPA: hypothetical protein VFT55_09800 [Planctomycetota bacterium]|nr:hypothetical protein [Planctomycetota bacterium]
MSRVSRRVLVLVFAAGALAACSLALPRSSAPAPPHGGERAAPRERELALPQRSPGTLPGSQLVAQLRSLPLAAREAAVWREVEAGNVPAFLGKLVPVQVEATVQGRRRTATFWCAPDYFGLGCDEDWFRMPITSLLAQRIADRWGCVLPTRAMVDAIWVKAPIKLAPHPFHPDSHDIVSVALFYEHHLRIEAQREGRGRDLLVAGIKKDIVSSALIDSWPGRVVIYGWHRPDGSPIQPLSKVHTDAHVDYSHGLRLVAEDMEVDGTATTVAAVLADPELHVLLSDEGPIPKPRYRLPAAAR